MVDVAPGRGTRDHGRHTLTRGSAESGIYCVPWKIVSINYARCCTEENEWNVNHLCRCVRYMMWVKVLERCVKNIYILTREASVSHGSFRERIFLFVWELHWRPFCFLDTLKIGCLSLRWDSTLFRTSISCFLKTSRRNHFRSESIHLSTRSYPSSPYKGETLLIFKPLPHSLY